MLCDGAQAVTEAEAVKAARADVVLAKQGQMKAISDEVARLRSTLRHLQTSQRTPALAAAHVLLRVPKSRISKSRVTWRSHTESSCGRWKNDAYLLQAFVPISVCFQGLCGSLAGMSRSRTDSE